MNTTFTLQQLKEILTLTPAQQQQIIEFGDQLATASDEEIVNSSVADDAPEMIRDIHRRSVRRARAAISRRKRKLRAKPAAEGDEERLSNGAKSRLLWFQDSLLEKLGRMISECIAEAKSAFSSLSPAQVAALSRRAYNLMIPFISPLLEQLKAGAKSLSGSRGIAPKQVHT